MRWFFEWKVPNFVLMHKVLIVGGGPAGLILAEQLSRFKQFHVHLHDHKKALGRKFLVAGDGGLNLSNNQPLEQFVSWYSHPIIQQTVRDFTCKDLELWVNELGIETYYGSSGKLFPKEGIKPITVLKAIVDRIASQGVHIHTKSKFRDFNGMVAYFEKEGRVIEESFDVLCLAMGGASWASTGSDGGWKEALAAKFKCNSFQSSNAGVEIKEGFPESYRGQFLKNVKVTVGANSVLGEIRFTDYGIEGSPVYALNEGIRGDQMLTIDLKPTILEAELKLQLSNWSKSRTEFLKQLKLGFGLSLLRDRLTKEEFMDNERLVGAIKNFPFDVVGLRPIEEAISTVGGVDMKEVDEHLEAVRYPNVFLLGEMLDWDTRTGGYLLQACFSAGIRVSKTLINRYEVD